MFFRSKIKKTLLINLFRVIKPLTPYCKIWFVVIYFFQDIFISTELSVINKIMKASIMLQRKEKIMKKPTHFLILKIVGFIGIFTTIAGIIMAFRGFGDFESNKFMIGSFMATFGMVAGVGGTVSGFAPEIAKAKAKSTRYIQSQTKEDLTAIASTAAEIVSDAVEVTARAVSDGMQKTMFCKYCGAKIDIDSKFCSSCGKEL